MRASNILIIFLTIYISYVISDCSFLDPVEVKIPRDGNTSWYIVLRYENGKENTTSCIISQVQPDSVQDVHINPDGTSFTFGGKFVISKCSPGKFSVEGMVGSPSTRYAVYVDYDDLFIVFRACYENTDYLWVVSIEKHPCKDVLKKMYKVLKDMKLDGPAIYRGCNDSF